MKRALTIAIVVLLLLPVLLAGGCRVGRRRFDAPMAIKPGPPGPFDAYSAANNQVARALRPMLHGRAIDRVCTGHGGCTPAGQGRAMFEDPLARIK